MQRRACLVIHTTQPQYSDHTHMEEEVMYTFLERLCVIVSVFVLAVRLGDTLNFILLLDGIRVGRSPRSINEFFCEAFGHGFEIAEG